MINRDDTRRFLENLDKWLSVVPPETRDWLESTIMGPALDELRELVLKSRPPVLFLVGRSGHGKSSVINALCGKQVADVGDVKPTTREARTYHVLFNNGESAWDLVDSRGLFESTSPSGGPREDVVEQCIGDMLKHEPDVVMHVISAPEVRALASDLREFGRIIKRASDKVGHTIPTIVVLTKPDALGNPREWPPDDLARKKADLVEEAVRYTTRDVLGVDLRRARPLHSGKPLYGYRIPHHPDYKAVIPACTLWDPQYQWNIETLQEFIGGELPKASQLDYYQALRKKHLLRKLAAGVTKRFAAIAGTIGSSPIPTSDIFLLSPLQFLLIAIIGGLSCRPVGESTCKEYTVAIGAAGAAGWCLRTAAQQLAKLIPWGGPVLSGAIAATGTLALGKSAEAYFFGGEVKTPAEFAKTRT